MAACVFFQDFFEQLGKKVHDLSSDTIRIFLTPTEPSVSGDAGLSDVADLVTNTNIGGAWPQVTDVKYTETGGTGTMTADATVITASGAVDAFQYYGLYNDSATGDKLICYWNHGSSVTLGNGDTFTITFGGDATDGTILTIAVAA